MFTEFAPFRPKLILAWEFTKNTDRAYEDRVVLTCAAVSLVYSHQLSVEILNPIVQDHLERSGSGIEKIVSMATAKRAQMSQGIREFVETGITALVEGTPGCSQSKDEAYVLL